MMQPTENTPDVPPRIRKSTLTLVGGVLALAMVAFFLLGFWPRHERILEREAIARETRDQPLVVEVVQPKSTQDPVDLTLPADIRAYAATALYARINGYLASWKVDINDRVRKGELMAVISAPDTDADLEQAVASLDQQRTGYELAEATYQRYQGLVPTAGVTQQQLDQFHSASEQAKANVEAAAAAVDKLKTLAQFERITAPFDGVVTARNYDVGALISASSTGPGQELFDVSEDDLLRVFVDVRLRPPDQVRPAGGASSGPEFPGPSFLRDGLEILGLPRPGHADAAHRIGFQERRSLPAYLPRDVRAGGLQHRQGPAGHDDPDQRADV